MVLLLTSGASMTSPAAAIQTTPRDWQHYACPAMGVPLLWMPLTSTSAWTPAAPLYCSPAHRVVGLVRITYHLAACCDWGMRRCNGVLCSQPAFLSALKSRSCWRWGSHAAAG
jgi:hypothetical protein